MNNCKLQDIAWIMKDEADKELGKVDWQKIAARLDKEGVLKHGKYKKRVSGHAKKNSGDRKDA